MNTDSRAAIIKRLVATAALALPLLVAQANIAGPAQAVSEFSSVPDSDQITAPVLINGVMKSTSGAAYASSELLLEAYPTVTSNTLGTVVNAQLVSRVNTSTTGSYSLKVPDVSSLSSLAGPTGLIDFDVMPTQQQSGVWPYSFTRRLVFANGTYTLQSATAPYSATAAATSAGAASMSSTTSSVPSPETQTTSTTTSTDPAIDSSPVTDDSTAGPDNSVDTGPVPATAQAPCGKRLVQTWATRPTVVGQWFSTTTGVTGDFQYTQGSTSTLGAGFSLTGKVGEWSSSGTTSRDSNNTQDYATKTGSGGWLFRTYFGVQKWYHWCNQRANYYTTNAAYWAGGNAGPLGQTVGSDVNKCVPEHAGDGWTQEDTTAITWSNGLVMKKPLGIDFSAKTGYSTKAKLVINFQSAHRLCGRGGYPGETPYVLAARP